MVGNSFYYITLNNQYNKVFTSTSDLNPKLILTSVGDSVKITFNDGSEGIINMITFDNLNVAIHKTENQIGVEKQFEKADSVMEQIRNDIDIKAAFEKMTDAEKKKFIQEFRSKKIN